MRRQHEPRILSFWKKEISLSVVFHEENNVYKGLYVTLYAYREDKKKNIKKSSVSRNNIREHTRVIRVFIPRSIEHWPFRGLGFLYNPFTFFISHVRRMQSAMFSYLHMKKINVLNLFLQKSPDRLTDHPSFIVWTKVYWWLQNSRWRKCWTCQWTRETKFFARRY